MADIIEPKPEAAELKAWTDPAITALDVSRTANNPSFGSDGGTGDCQHA